MKTKKLVILSLLTALDLVFARIFLIPVAFTHGNINLSDVGIVIAGLLFGIKSGALVGAASGFLLDLLSGYPQYMLFSLLIHGVQGAIIGTARGRALKGQLLAGGASILVLVGGYFIANSLFYGWTAGLLGLMTDLVQGIVGVVLGIFLAKRLSRARA